MSFTAADSHLSRDIAEVDAEVAEILVDELARQSETLEMIASENFTSHAVLQAVGSVLTNKYAEGLPGARYYGGCEVVDRAESLAIERAKRVFGAEHVNVQPHSGATSERGGLHAPCSTMADRILGHGHSRTAAISRTVIPGQRLSGRHLRRGTHYGVRERRWPHRHTISATRSMAREVRPKLIVCRRQRLPAHRSTSSGLPRRSPTRSAPC